MNSAYFLTKGEADEAKKSFVYKDFINGLSEAGIIDNDGNTRIALHLERFSLNTTKPRYAINTIQAEDFKNLYNAIAYIDVWVLRKDEVPETYPPSDKMKNITEFHIEKECTSFNGNDIQPQLKALTNVEKIHIKVTVELISRSVLRQLAKLNENRTKPIQFFVQDKTMYSYVFDAVFGAESDVKGLVELVAPNDRLVLDCATKTIKIPFEKV